MASNAFSRGAYNVCTVLYILRWFKPTYKKLHVHVVTVKIYFDQKFQEIGDKSDVVSHPPQLHSSVINICPSITNACAI